MTVRPITSASAFFLLSRSWCFGSACQRRPSYSGKPKFELADVATALRKNLGDEVENLPFDERGTAKLERFLLRLPEIERGLLSRKKQRALDEMEICVERLAGYALEQRDQPLVDHIYQIQRILSSAHLDGQPDRDEVASCCMVREARVKAQQTVAAQGYPRGFARSARTAGPDGDAVFQDAAGGGAGRPAGEGMYYQST